MRIAPWWLVFVTTGCMSVEERAQRIAQDALIVDTHIDAPIRLAMRETNPSAAPSAMAFDLELARAGGLDVAFMSIFVPAAVDAHGEGLDFAHRLIDRVQAMIAAHPDGFALATCVDDLQRNVARGRVSLAMGMENGGPLAGRADAIDELRARGIRYVTLTHAEPNALGDASYSREARWGGLSEAGRAMVLRLNELGIMVDVSHVADATFWQVLEASRAPVIASHSSARHFTPGFERNISDDMVIALARHGGVVQVNFGSGFLTASAREWVAAHESALTQFLAETNLDRDAHEARAFRASYRERHPFPHATVDDVLDHIEHLVDLVGVAHVGLGSDFDGVGDTLPLGLENVARYPNLIAGLLRRGYRIDEIRAILGENLLRVWRQVERFGAERGQTPTCAQPVT